MFAHEVIFAARDALERLGVNPRAVRVDALEKVSCECPPSCACGERWRFAVSVPPSEPGKLRVVELLVRGKDAVEVVSDSANLP